jgi:hypothetical protein
MCCHKAARGAFYPCARRRLQNPNDFIFFMKVVALDFSFHLPQVLPHSKLRNSRYGQNIGHTSWCKLCWFCCSSICARRMQQCWETSNFLQISSSNWHEILAFWAMDPNLQFLVKWTKTLSKWLNLTHNYLKEKIRRWNNCVW